MVVSANVVQVEAIRRNGAVYTPSVLADYVAKKVVHYLFEAASGGEVGGQRGGLDSSRVRRLKILDPACGDGELLVAVWSALSEAIQAMSRAGRIVAGPDPLEALCGIDIDAAAVRSTGEKISELRGGARVATRLNLLSTNALFPFGLRPPEVGWDAVRTTFGAPRGFDIVIANPPWGADTGPYRERLEGGDFSLYGGQFDTADLFVELALAIVRPGGFFGFILPDSLFNAERERLRRMLVSQTEIRFIGRFGEKIFGRVNRACAVVVCCKRKPGALATVDCLHLTPAFRRAILGGGGRFEQAEGMLAHRVGQVRFAANDECLFDIDVEKADESLVGRIKGSGATFRDYLSSSRGVELSKSGRVCRCCRCGLWMPLPMSPRAKCPHCGASLSLSLTDAVRIVARRPVDGYAPILVGESVCRYRLETGYWIDVQKPGIKYKDRAHYEEPKIVVRKTGVGLSAAIDYSGSLTNQVVYALKPRDVGKAVPPLEFFLGVLNSRALYYYLVKSYGETEWRSHPYVTQRQLLDLPVPRVDVGDGATCPQVHEIATLVGRHAVGANGMPPEADAEVERLVSMLYGLSRKDYKRIYETLDSVEDLLPVRALKRVRISDIFGR